MIKREGMTFVAEIPAGAKTAQFRDLLIVVAEGEPTRFIDLKNTAAGLQVLGSGAGSALGDLVVDFDQHDQQTPAKTAS